MEKKIKDNELGTIVVRTNPRATRYILRISGGQLIATMPPSGSEKRLKDFIEEKRERLRAMLQTSQTQKQLLDETTSTQYTTFRLHIFRTERDNFYMKLDSGVLHIACPQKTDFEQNQVQELLHSLIERALRHQAKYYLPERLRKLALQHRFSYRNVKINNSKSRWGSCSSKKDINLSLSLMTLPWHLIDYVLLHELCHTIEMNHSERFWKLMDRVTANRAKQLRKELKTFQP